MSLMATMALNGLNITQKDVLDKRHSIAAIEGNEGSSIWPFAENSLIEYVEFWVSVIKSENELARPLTVWPQAIDVTRLKAHQLLLQLCRSVQRREL